MSELPRSRYLVPAPSAAAIAATSSTPVAEEASSELDAGDSVLRQIENVHLGVRQGFMQPSIYHRGLMVGETPNIDRIGQEGAIFMDYVAMQSCTSGRNAFFTGMYPVRTGMIPPQLPGSPSYLRPGTPAVAVFLHDLGYTTGEFGKNHLGDHTAALPTVGFQEYWGYLYHLDAMQGVSFPDINRHRPCRASRRRARTRRSPGSLRSPVPMDPKTTICLTPPRPVIWCNSSDGTEANQTCKDEGPLTLDRSRTVDEEISAKVVDFLDRNDPKKTNKPFFVWYNPARMHVTTVLSDKHLHVCKPIVRNQAANRLTMAAADVFSDRSVVMTYGKLLRSRWSASRMSRSSRLTGMTLPEAPMLAPSLR